jgi:hypothetical protein
MRRLSRAMPTAEEQALCRVQELVLALCARDRIEPPHANNLLDGVAGAVVGVRVCAQDAAEVRLQPELVGGYPLVAPLVDAVALDGAGDIDLHAHVQAREGIVAAVLLSANAVRHGSCLRTSIAPTRPCSACRAASR